MPNVMGDTMGGAMTGASLGSIIPGVGTVVGAVAGGLVGGINSLFNGSKNPLEDFMKEQTYKFMEQNFYNKFLSTLNKSTATTSSLLANSMSKTGNYGGSSYVANKQRQDIEAKNRQGAQDASADYMGKLYGTGMNLFAEGALTKYKEDNSFTNEMLGLGGGLMGRQMSLNENTNNNNSLMQWMKMFQSGSGDNGTGGLTGFGGLSAGNNVKNPYYP
jgi:hypothetical protein